MKYLVLTCILIFTLLQINAQQKISTREMNRINWMEFAEYVPGNINSVLLPTGTLEPHGVINNGADNTAPEAMALAIADDLNALIAPTLNYGITGSMAAFPGAFQITEEAYRPFIKDILRGLAKNGFKNIIILNGHGGGQTKVLQEVAAEVATELGVRTLVLNWWSFASDVTLEVFKEDGGHAGLNETAYIQAIDPTLVHKEKYSADMATAYPATGTWSASPFPSSIGLYKEGQGYPNFDQAQAHEYFKKVNAKVSAFIQEIIKKWDLAGL
ncbi:creatinine amidohydrolase [Algoriphagus ratkowskyi]|uniref:Creatininase family protein n=2 Tax=Algoriphagus ratkowskyi TaxID=57028 RepID=A0A2W7RL55_9BACT|nr:creatininase family protein [Algoriphagus ratkowskyi]PZX61124.1 creatinine amidohydrolase [Algoriphagus ratkowskyi]TXD79254.1 creatininase family protein [Algoriphagus ratkowskyi]